MDRVLTSKQWLWKRNTETKGALLTDASGARIDALAIPGPSHSDTRQERNKQHTIWDYKKIRREGGGSFASIGNTMILVALDLQLSSEARATLALSHLDLVESRSRWGCWGGNEIEI